MVWLLVSFAVAYFLLTLVRVFIIRRLSGPLRFLANLLSGLVFFGISAGILYYYTDRYLGSGPDDWGAIWHARQPLAEKYGSGGDLASCQVVNFDKDPDGSGSGTYRIYYRRNGHHGLVLSHYDNTARKFDRDEVREDP